MALFMKCLGLCTGRQFSHTSDSDNDDSMLGDNDDPLLWYKDLMKHSHGDFSFAMVQANSVIEDYSQVETGRNATFVGVYDGHAGKHASEYIVDYLFTDLLKLARENEAISEDVLRTSFSETENGFLSFVERERKTEPIIAVVGSCCLVGVIWKRTLYVANLGDSRAVIGFLYDQSNKIVAEQLTKYHNANRALVRKDLISSSHPEETRLLVMEKDCWRIKGIIQISRSIGDAYLKDSKYAMDSNYLRFHLPDPIKKYILRSDQDIITRDLEPKDKFLIFASDGLWEFMSNQEVVEIVQKYPKERAAQKKRKTCDEIKKMVAGPGPGARSEVHDDITTIVIFIDRLEMFDNMPEVSVRGFVDDVGSSKFNF